MKRPNVLKPDRLARLLVAGLLLLAGAPFGPITVVQADVKAYEGRIKIPTYPWWPPVRHPYFRGTDGRNIYPYPMLDNLRRIQEPHLWRTVVLENEYLRVTFLPELGGRIYEVWNKITDTPVFYVNHVIKPGLIGQCGAWISGGVEFNTGPAGHTVSAVQPVDVVIAPPNPDGSRSIAVGEVERVYRTRWTVLVTLRPGRSFLEEAIRIYNSTETVRPYYFWNCTAAPNTDGFRFVYPMTLGTDHSGRTFYTWPISNGKDLSLGRNYQDASSIFAYECNQDFFGSYDEGADCGVVAYANHHLLPGKKAWTWGHGGYGTMHQMDLSDTDGPYNEVQTGPLPTQADVGRLDPSEAVAWKEWWYPVHGIGGFDFANRDVAVKVLPEENGLRLRMIGTGTWSPVRVSLYRQGIQVGSARSKLTPREPAELKFEYQGAIVPVEIEISAGKQILARFRAPLDLPVRTPPAKIAAGDSASELAQAGWQEYLFARFTEAKAQFNRALEKDPKSVTALTGLAYLDLDRDTAATATNAQAALAVDPDAGRAHFALAVAEFRLDHQDAALDEAWKAALDPATAIPGRSLAGKILIRRGDWQAAIRALAETGANLCDPVSCNRLALAELEIGDKEAAAKLARQNLLADPLDTFARSILWLAGEKTTAYDLAPLISSNTQDLLDLVAEYAELGQEESALALLADFYFKPQRAAREPVPCYWAAYLAHRLGKEQAATDYLAQARSDSIEDIFPHRYETIPVLRWALESNPKDGKATLLLGHLLFSLGRHAEGRAEWQRAADLGESPAVAYRALGMACRQLDGDLDSASKYLDLAHLADPSDPIVARDLGQVLFALADKAVSKDQSRDLIMRTRQILMAAFPAGKGRSDFVALLARANNRLGDYGETAKLLDSVRITIWEGAQEAHDLFKEAHLELGSAQLDAGNPTRALAEFNRALEYPKNLATGKLEGTPEADIQYLRGQALAAIGQKEAAIEAWQKAANEPASKNAKMEEARAKAKRALEDAK
ncbi:MAG: DUF5107 domain-containing protein [Candidatus Omnitrophica bacterium]|nr:DUF5107 domain-containing protein [Candidatus Omnitrophota bacterium]